MAKLQVPKNTLSSADVDSNKITDAHLTVMWAIALWYNGVGIQHGSRVYHIGSTKPPALQTLIGCSDAEWNDIYGPAFEDLENRGGVVGKTLLRRTVPWAPTKELLITIDNLFSHHLERIVVPHSAFNSKLGHIGDPYESLTHRTAVEQVVSWLYEKGFDWKLYPGNVGHQRPDVRGITPFDAGQQTMMASKIEVISDHNNKKMYVKKYNMFSKDPSRTSLWIFKNRKLAAKGITWLSEINLSNYTGEEWPKCRIANTPLNNPENYSVQTLNNYLERSREKSTFTCTGLDYVQTIAGLYADRDDDIIRRPVTIWNADTAEITLVDDIGRSVSLSVDGLNHGGKLRMDEHIVNSCTNPEPPRKPQPSD